MNGKKLELVGMIVLPKFAGFISGVNVFKNNNIRPSHLFDELFLEHVVLNLPEKTVACHRVISEFDNADLLEFLGPNFCPLEAADIGRLFQFQTTDSIFKFNADGACNHVVIADMTDKVIADTIWRAQVFKHQKKGWCAELYRKPKITCQELIFSGYLKK